MIERADTIVQKLLAPKHKMCQFQLNQLCIPKNTQCEMDKHRDKCEMSNKVKYFSNGLLAWRLEASFVFIQLSLSFCLRGAQIKLNRAETVIKYFHNDKK